jgi:hypothetical protein
MAVSTSCRGRALLSVEGRAIAVSVERGDRFAYLAQLAEARCDSHFAPTCCPWLNSCQVLPEEGGDASKHHMIA